MNSTKLAFSLLIVTLIFSCGFAQESKPPEWVTTLPTEPDYLFAVGNGDGKRESLLDALVHLSGAIETSIYHQKDSILVSDSIFEKVRSFILQSFGKVQVKFLAELSTESTKLEEGGGFESAVKLIFQDGDNLLKYEKYLYESNAHAELAYQFDIIENNIQFTDLIEELKLSGIEFDFYCNNDYCHALAKYYKAMPKK